ncbi:arylsulfatase [Flammeovirga sp. EKP202]|uniref:arylsulfatase n=1 Tax=Flammeovirga sp. EKP202 TaxID=2770592 RepID=UPI00165F96F1|nr:arylsulfatase [Flammeovirga sp. EKP202]MBD0402012.1 arylsulfatase [Flammeovirga sp. EKP202]
MKNNFNYFLFIVACIISSCSTNKYQQSQDGKKSLTKQPNIVFILVDDAGWGDFSCYGQEKFTTPNIDALAQSGMKFNSHYAGSTVCAPSRSTLMTGLHTGHSPIRGNKEVKPEGQVPIPADIASLPKMMQSKGYKTGMFGKWGLGYPGSEGAPNNQGFDEFYGYNCQRLAHTYYPLYLRHNGEKVMLEGNEEGGQKEYTHHLIHDQALNFIDENKDEPFFLYLPYTIPHAEVVAPEDSIFQHYKEVYPKGKPYVNKRNHNPNLTHEQRFMMGTYADQEYPRAAFATMMHHLDISVGEIMDKLKEHGLDENTIIFFSSDNGPHSAGGADPKFFNSNGPFRGIKRDLYEGGIRVPMIVSWPNVIKKNTETDHPSAFWDVFPTLADIVRADIEEKANIDGISFLPTLLGEDQKQEKHDYFYWEFHERGGSRAIRIGDWKIVQNKLKQKAKSKIEVYHLPSDPGEENDVAAENPEIVKQGEELFKSARIPNQTFRFPVDNI